jgi:hypothetical protein
LPPALLYERGSFAGWSVGSPGHADRLPPLPSLRRQIPVIETPSIAPRAPQRAQTSAEGLAASGERAGDRGCVAFVGSHGVFALADVSLVESNRGAYLGVLECRRSSCVGLGAGRALGPTGCLSSHGRTARGDLPSTLIQPVCIDEGGAEVFVVSSHAWLLHERASNDRARRKTRLALDGLARRVAAGELCDPDRIGRLAARILARDDVHPSFDWRHKDRSFLYVERPHPVDPRVDEGTYVVRTTGHAARPLGRAWAGEREGVVRAPVFVAALAFMVERVLRTRRSTASLRALAAEALAALEPLPIVDLGPPRR